MPSWRYNSLQEDAYEGRINTASDTFRCMLLRPSYTPNRSHNRRDDVVSHECSGTGYTAGGVVVTITVTTNNSLNRTEDAISTASWTNLTIADGVRYGVVYKARGGAASADELCYLLDFGATTIPSSADFATSSNGPFIVTHDD